VLLGVLLRLSATYANTTTTYAVANTTITTYAVATAYARAYSMSSW